MAPSNGRRKPNILITGTPGTGKTTTASALAEATQFRHINIGDLVKEKNLHDGWDDDFDCYVINEDLVSFSFHFPKLNPLKPYRIFTHTYINKNQIL